MSSLLVLLPASALSPCSTAGFERSRSRAHCRRYTNVSVPNLCGLLVCVSARDFPACPHPHAGLLAYRKLVCRAIDARAAAAEKVAAKRAAAQAAKRAAVIAKHQQ